MNAKKYLLSLVPILFLIACDSSRINTTGDPCAGDYNGMCGAPCAATDSCANGMFCAEGACTADCSPNSPCAGGFVCDQDGQCVLDPRTGTPQDDGNGATGVPDDEGPGSGCLDVEVAFREEIPSVMLVVDRSGSMEANFPGAADRWEAVKQALIDPDDGVVRRLEDRVRFGLMLYTSDGGFPDCPQLIGEEIPIALNNYEAIFNAYAPTDYFDSGDTPTAEAIVEARKVLTAFEGAGSKIIVLATDGEPDTCEDSDAHNEQTNAQSVQTVQETFTMGIDLSVIAVGDDVGEDHLQDLANAGAGRALNGSEGNATAYEPSDTDGLVADFTAIINGVRSCEVELNHMVSADQAALGTVLFDGTPLGFEDADGWRLSSPTAIELLGDACDRLKQDAGALNITFPCDVVAPI